MKISRHSKKRVSQRMGGVKKEKGIKNQILCNIIQSYISMTDGTLYIKFRYKTKKKKIAVIKDNNLVTILNEGMFDLNNRIRSQAKKIELTGKQMEKLKFGQELPVSRMVSSRVLFKY